MSERFEISVDKLHALTRQRICKKLDIREDYGGDFRTLAAHLDMSSDDLDLISQERNPTHKVLRWWGRNPENTVSKLREVLMEMGRLDCVKILDEIPEKGEYLEHLEELHLCSNSCVASDPPRVEVLEYKHLKPDQVDGAEIKDHQIDVLLLTVTDTEFLAAYKILPSPKVVDAGELGPIYFGKIGLNDVALLKTSSGAVSVAGPLATCLAAIKRFNPRVILSIGVCFGMDREKLELGDVLVSAKMGLYGPAKINRNGQIYSRGPLFECDGRLQKLFDFGKVGWKGPTEEKTPNVHVGLVISGPQTIENYDRKKQLRNLYPEALGGEQVGEGLYSICELSKLPWLVCKGVADWADGDNMESWQQFSAAASASFVEHVMLNSYIPGKK